MRGVTAMICHSTASAEQRTASGQGQRHRLPVEQGNIKSFRIVTSSITMTLLLTNGCNHTPAEHTAPLPWSAAHSRREERRPKNSRHQQPKQDRKHHATGGAGPTCAAKRRPPRPHPTGGGVGVGDRGDKAKPEDPRGFFEGGRGRGRAACRPASF